jgi:hypothetical protein
MSEGERRNKEKGKKRKEEEGKKEENIEKGQSKHKLKIRTDIIVIFKSATI